MENIENDRLRLSESLFLNTKSGCSVLGNVGENQHMLVIHDLFVSILEASSGDKAERPSQNEVNLRLGVTEAIVDTFSVKPITEG